MADLPFPLSPEEAARVAAYYGGSDPSVSPPAPPPGIDPSWLGGQAPPPGVGLPPVSQTAPGALFGGPLPPSPPAAPPPQTLDDGLRAAFPVGTGATPGEIGPPPPPKPVEAPAPTPDPVTTSIRQPVSFERAPSPRPTAIGVGMGPDAFGVEAARKGLRNTFEGDRGALQGGADAEKGRAVVLANGAAQIAREKEEDAAIQHLEQDQASQRFKDYSDETQRQIDTVKSTQIGSRLYQDGAGKALAIIGGIFGGMYQGLNRLSSNPFIDQLNKNIDRDIAVQEKNLENQKQAVAERRGVLADMRNTFKDDQLAKLQARNLYYEAFKDQIASEAAQYDSPAIQAKADMAISAVSREQAKLDLDGAIKKAAAAQAAAAAAAARQEHARKAALEERAMRVSEGRLLVDAAEADAKGGKKAGDQLADLSKAMAKPELVESKKLISDLKQKLVNPETGEIDGTRRIPGTGPLADFREWGTKNPLTGTPVPLPGVSLSSEERTGRQDWNRLALSYRHAVTGAGGSDKEAAEIEKSFAGANTPAEQANAIRQADAFVAELESRTFAGYPKDVVEEYKRRTAEEHSDRPRTARRFAP